MISCPECGCEYNRVVDSRTSKSAVRRRRECENCSARFTTYEMQKADLAKFASRLFMKDFAPAVESALVLISEKKH